jgi:hypothetical protein
MAERSGLHRVHRGTRDPRAALLRLSPSHRKTHPALARKFQRHYVGRPALALMYCDTLARARCIGLGYDAIGCTRANSQSE